MPLDADPTPSTPAPSRAGPQLIAQAVGSLRAAGFEGALASDTASLAAVSTDNSVYQLMPQLLAAPKSAADVSTLVAVLARPEFASLPLTARGGGTGTNGQSLNSGVTVDFRRHMNKILAVNIDEAWVDVEPGVVLDQLNEALTSTGLFFAPETSTSSRCTIGGMVATDASGKGSRIWGKTSDNVLGLSLVLQDGRILDSLTEALPETLAQTLTEACRRGIPPLKARLPDLPRRFTGYDLLRAENATRDWWRLLIGAEGTLGLVTKVRLKLIPRPKHRRLMIVAFSNFSHALNAAEKLLVAQPLAVECLDEWVQRLAHEAGLLTGLPPSLLGTTDARPVWDFVEFVGEDAAALEVKVAETAQLLAGLPGYVGHHTSADPAEISRLWAIRSASVGLLAKGDGRRVPISFVEDCALPPARLAEFVTRFATLMQHEGLRYGIYGHADVGCLHVRPALDMSDASDRARFGRISDAVFRLVSELGGIFWGEHGKGVRGDYLERFVGPEAYAAFQEVKRAFDPNERFNPGKLVTLSRPRMAVKSTPMRAPMPEDAGVFERAFRCNGNALCHSAAASQTLCPSFKATADSLHSPKGRSEAIRHWLSQERAERRDAALDHAVKEALDLCLSCRACASTCPVQVDIPTLKSAFLTTYYQRYRRPLWQRFVILADRLAPQMTGVGWLLSNRFAQAFLSRVAAQIGLIDLPRPSPRPLRRLGLPIFSAKTAARQSHPKNRAFIALDSMTGLYDTEALAQMGSGLRALGLEPALLRLASSGKPAETLGDKAAFQRAAKRLHRDLSRIETLPHPILAADPSLATLVRTDLPKLGLGVKHPPLPLTEFLLALDLPAAAPREAAPIKILPHCLERADAPSIAADWQKIGTRLSLTITTGATGCCGMAGAWGHLRANQTTSARIFDLSWRAELTSPGVAASGFSCRCQTERMSGKTVPHPLGKIAEALCDPAAEHVRPARG